MTELLDGIIAVVEILESHDMPYLIGGSVASGLHGVPKSTQDVDLVVGLAPHHAEPFVLASGSRFYADLRAIQGAIRSRRSFNLIFLETMVKLDVLPLRRSGMTCSG